MRIETFWRRPRRRSRRCTLAAHAQDLPKHHFKVLIQDSPTPHVKLLEAPLWNEWIPAASKGQITADAAPYDQVGIPDDAVLRLLKLGAFDFASFDIAKVAGDDPKFEGCDLSGLTLTFEDARKACEAWRDDRGQADAAEMERQAARDRHRAAAGAVVRDRGEELRRPQGQEAARLHQDDGGLHAAASAPRRSTSRSARSSPRCRTRWSIAP